MRTWLSLQGDLAAVLSVPRLCSIFCSAWRALRAFPFPPILACAAHRLLACGQRQPGADNEPGLLTKRAAPRSRRQGAGVPLTQHQAPARAHLK